MKVLSQILDPRECNTLASQIQVYEQPFGDSLVPKSFSAYALPATESLLLELTPKVSKIIGEELFPTYSYCRIYYNGASMRSHKDRAACEISMSLSLSGDPWPLWFNINGKATPISMKKGDAVLYKGLEVEHWREPYIGNGCTQVFLHWVLANGENASWKYDRRPSIGAKESEKNYWGKS